MNALARLRFNDLSEIARFSPMRYRSCKGDEKKSIFNKVDHPFHNVFTAEEKKRERKRRRPSCKKRAERLNFHKMPHISRPRSKIEVL